MIFGVVGQRKGGTSAVAGILEILGVDMKYRDQTRLDDADLRQAMNRSSSIVRKLIKERGNDWGFKHPLVDIEELLPFLEGKRVKFLYIYRDPVAVIQHFKPTASQQEIKDSLEEMKKIADLPPGLSISYEKLLRDTEKEVMKIALYVEKPFKEEAVLWVTQGGGYRNIHKYVPQKTQKNFSSLFSEEAP